MSFIPETQALPSTQPDIEQPMVQQLDQSNFLYYEKVSDDKSVQVITAGGSEFVDDEYGNSGHSPFTYFLLKKLNDNKQKFTTASQLAEEVKPLVGNNTTQIPQNGVLFNSGDEGGEFVFSHAQIAALNLELPKDEPPPIPKKEISLSPAVTEETKPITKANKPWYKNPWFWAGVAISGGAAVYLTNNLNKDDSSRPEPRYPNQ